MTTITTAERFGAYLLVFVAVIAFIFILISWIRSFGMEYVDRKVREDYSSGRANNIYFFIAKGALLQLQLSVGLLLSAIAISILLFFQIYNFSIVIPAGIVAFLLGNFLPRLYFLRKVHQRATAIEKSILDLALGFTGGLRAGLALPQSLEVFAKRCSGPIQEELMIVIRDHRLGLPLPEALQRMCDRVPSEDLQLLVVSIRLTAKSGGSMLGVLGKITEMIQKRTDFKRKLSALTAQGRFEAIAMALAPLAAFLLLLFCNSDLMMPMLQTGIGWTAIGIMLLLEIIGYIAIRAILDIKV